MFSTTRVTPTKFETLIELLETGFFKEFYQVLGDIESLTAGERAQLLKSLLGQQLPMIGNNNDLVRLGFKVFRIDYVDEESDWNLRPESIVAELINSMRVVSDFADVRYSGELNKNDTIDVDFEYVAIINEVDDDGSSSSRIGVPEGGYIDWTSKTSFDKEARIVRNLHFVVRAYLGEDEEKQFSEDYTYLVNADVHIDEHGYITLLTVLTNDDVWPVCDSSY